MDIPQLCKCRHSRHASRLTLAVMALRAPFGRNEGPVGWYAARVTTAHRAGRPLSCMVPQAEAGCGLQGCTLAAGGRGNHPG